MSAKSWQKVLSILVVAGLFLILVQPGRGATISAGPRATDSHQGNLLEVETKLLDQFNAQGTAGYMIYFRASPDLSAAQKMRWGERGWYVMNTLKAAAEQSQARVRTYLDGQGVQYKSFWIDNIIVVENSSRATLDGLMAFSEIESLKERRIMSIIEPEIVVVPDTALAIEPNISHVGAPSAWALGINGAGSVVASIDTGVRYTHDALVNHYRGNLGGGVFDHNYNWFDPDNPGNLTPSDGNGHGTLTMGIIIGDDGGANQIGMAPGAKWMTCSGCPQGGCTTTALLGCAQFLAAPTDLNGANADPSKRPNVVNNSWADNSQAYDDWYQGVVDAWHAAGIYPVFGNGNGYPHPNTVANPARYGNVTGVGSSGQSDGQYATHSNWGPTDNPDTINPRGHPNLKPQVIAPGVDIRSSFITTNTSYRSGMTGTSMSVPHVTGLVALVWQAGPCLIGDYAATETLIEETAIPVPYDDQTGGGAHSPNNASGWGEINALAAVQAALNYCGDSALAGRVVESTKAPGDPISAAVVAATSVSGTYQTATDDRGYYTLTLRADTYDVSVSAFGYQPWTQNDVVVSGTVAMNPALTLADWYTVAGEVTDSTTGWPLYAQITIDGYPGDPLWTDPETGAYSISLPEGVTYTFDVAAFYPGYVAESREVGPLTGGEVVNFALEANALLCSAPGYYVSGGFVQGFEDETPPALPAGWAVVDVTGTSGDWFTHAGTRYPSGQPAHGGSNLVLFNSYSVSSGSTRLYLTSRLNMTTLTSPDLSFWVYHDTGYSTNNDRIQVQVSTDGGTNWVDVGAPVSRYSATAGWIQHTISLAAYAANTDLMLGFQGISAYGNDVHLDDIVLGGTSDCIAPNGSLVTGNVYDAQTLGAMNGATVESDTGDDTITVATPDDAGVDDGFYYLYSDTGTHRVFMASYPLHRTVTATLAITSGETIAHDFYLPLGQLSVDPTTLEVNVVSGYSLSTDLVLTNDGASATDFELQEVPGTPAGGAAPEDIGTAWETMAPLPSARALAAVVADTNGYVYVIGGTSDVAASTPTNTNYRYDTATNTWITRAALPTTIDSLDGTVIDNKIYVPGGAATDTTYVYNIATNTWAQIATGGGYTPRSRYQVVAIGTDLYVLGGIVTSTGASTTEVWKLNTITGAWSAGVPMQKPRMSFSAGAIDGMIYVAGGVLFPGFTPDMSAEKFDGTAWSYIAGVPSGGGAYDRWSYNAHGVGVDGYFYAIEARNGAGNIAYDTNEHLMVGASVLPEVPWLAETPITGTIGADSSIVVEVTFTAFPTMTAGSTYTATLKAKTSDPVNSTIEVPVTLHVISTAYGVGVSANQEITGKLGAVITYTVTITNLSTGPSDSFTLTLGPHNWTTTLDTSQIGPLQAGEKAVFHVVVQVPADVGLHASDTVQVTVTSHGDPAIDAVTTLTTRVSTYLLLPLVMRQSPSP